MVSTNKKEIAGKKKKIKVLNLKKESVRNLTSNDSKKIKGGVIGLSLVGSRFQSRDSRGRK